MNKKKLTDLISSREVRKEKEKSQWKEGRFQHVSRTQLFFLDIVIIIASLFRIVWIAGEFLFSCLCLYSIYFISTNKIETILSGDFSSTVKMLLSGALIGLSVFFLIQGIEDTRREFRLWREYIAWHTCKWAKKPIKENPFHDEEAIGAKNEKAAQISHRAALLFFAMLIAAIVLFLSENHWQIPVLFFR